LHVDHHGERTGGPEVVLVHGWAMHGGVWGELPPSLAQECQVHVVDLPGHGYSTAPESMSLDSLCNAVEPAIAQGAVLVGWSLGAQLALRFACTYPQRIAALVLIGATPRFVQAQDWPHGMSQVHFDAFAAQLATDQVATLQRFVALASLGSASARAQAQRLLALLAERPTPSLAALSAGLTVLRDVDLRGRLATMYVPTWIIHGAADAVVPASAGEWLAGRLPRSELRILDGSGHVPHVAQSERVTRIILDAVHAHAARA
jgi:pimeloyl-[acyl-carrier protein] methyl ester esterase